MNKPTDQDLLPCPFCGAKAESYGVADGQYYVACVNNDCNGQNGYEDTRDQAKQRWNRRAAVQPAGVAVPEGWKLVSIEPTEEMIQAGIETPCIETGDDIADEREDYRRMYSAMLAAAPYPVSGETAEVKS